MTPERIRRAAEVLRERAHNFRATCMRGDGTWPGPAVQRHHDEMLALADELEKMAVWVAELSRIAEATRMFVCDLCGNKRCPHSDDHRNACTESNEPGQPGSRYQ